MKYFLLLISFSMLAQAMDAHMEITTFNQENYFADQILDDEDAEKFNQYIEENPCALALRVSYLDTLSNPEIQNKLNSINQMIGMSRQNQNGDPLSTELWLSYRAPESLEVATSMNVSMSGEASIGFTRILGEAGYGGLEITARSKDNQSCPIITPDELREYLVDVLTEMTVRWLSHQDVTRRLRGVSNQEILNTNNCE